MSKEEASERGPWAHIIRGMWRSPLGLIGVMLTTVSATLMVLGLVVEIFGLTNNVYVSIFAFMILPGGMITGLILIPLAAYLRRRQWFKYGIAREHLQINLSDHKHRKLLVWLIVLTVLFFTLLTVIGFEGYEFSDSPVFCGTVCHKVMAPEYSAYRRSPHAKVACVECHIGPGVSWFVKAKISGLRQVWGVLTNSYDRPIPDRFRICGRRVIPASSVIGRKNSAANGSRPLFTLRMTTRRPPSSIISPFILAA